MIATDKRIPGYVRLTIAGLAGAASSFVSHPFDLVKYRMQMSGKGSTEGINISMLKAMQKVITKEGYMALFNGLSASILRQLTLTTTRLGLYTIVVDKFTAEDGTPPSVWLQINAGLLTGAMGAIVGNPADVALVRMSVDGANPPNERYKYKGTFNAFRRIIKEEGLGVLWIGIMSMKYVDGKPEYKGMFDVCSKMVTTEGITSLWKGVTANFARILPNNFMMFITLELLTKAYKKIVLGDLSGRGF
ncbi:hypothetical protein RUM44_009013 [Polyplax serrata]|uniref:Uncharacterized protein n=1 Tax=Polyplax serrata TaxID=468196 RepID=A0ABR1ARJ2_POLSC